MSGQNVLPKVELPYKPELTVSLGLLEEIRYLHKVYPAKEWSGPLFYTFEGNLDKPSQIKIRCEGTFLCDLGTTGHTAYDVAEHIEKILEYQPRLLSGEVSRGLLHTHHTMGVFFSTEDTNELHDNTKHYPMYLSLIVNNKEEFQAKLCFIADIVNSFTYKGVTKEDILNKNTWIMKDESKDVLHTMDCKIIVESKEPTVSEAFKNRVTQMLEEKNRAVVTTHTTAVTHSPYSNKDKYQIPVDIAFAIRSYAILELEMRSIIASMYETNNKHSVYAINADLTNTLIKIADQQKIVKDGKLKAFVKGYITDMWKEFGDHYCIEYKEDIVSDVTHYRICKYYAVQIILDNIYRPASFSKTPFNRVRELEIEVYEDMLEEYMEAAQKSIGEEFKIEKDKVNGGNKTTGGTSNYSGYGNWDNYGNWD